MSEDFTTDRYRELLTTAKARFAFLRFGAHAGATSGALWRHDIDFSPQRALALARIEQELGAVATYFIQLSSRYYSAFEPETTALLRELPRLGHDVGLHFDAGVGADLPAQDHGARLGFEARVLEQLVEAGVRSFSLHNPTTIAGAGFSAVTCAGLINASSPELLGEFTYCSDSNGVWRHRPLDEVIADPRVRKLYALTHPEWWQDSAMAPRARIQRCLDGRASAGARHYDALLLQHGRPNA